MRMRGGRDTFENARHGGDSFSIACIYSLARAVVFRREPFVNRPVTL
jgi:hypothetical protein